MTIDQLQFIQTVAQCTKTVALFIVLLVLIRINRYRSHNSPLEVKRRAVLAQMAQREEEYRLREQAMKEDRNARSEESRP